MRRALFVETFAGWRATARELLRRRVPPDAVLWHGVGDAQPLLDGLGDDTISVAGAAERGAPLAGARVPRVFLAVAEGASCHRDPNRWALLYRVLWRLTQGEPRLMEVCVDPDVHRLLALEAAVRRDVHKLHAFVRFRAVPGGGEEHFVAWFAPEHHVVERATPFFARRFPCMRWSILTPLRSAHWDREALRFGPGVSRSAAPAEDALEALWRTYYASVFNPARVRPRAMRGEMPKRYWEALPEAALIPGLIHGAPRRVRRMLEQQAADAAAPRAAVRMLHALSAPRTTARGGG